MTVGLHLVSSTWICDACYSVLIAYYMLLVHKLIPYGSLAENGSINKKKR